MEVSKGRETPGKSAKVSSGETPGKNTKVSATVAPFQMSSSSPRKVQPMPPIGPLVAAGHISADQLFSDDPISFGKTVAEGLKNNLQFCTVECATCLKQPVGPFTHALVVRVNAGGYPVRIKIAGGKDVYDVYVVKVSQLQHEKYVLLGSSLSQKVSLYLAYF
jgi:hypothetical protein